MKKIVLGIEGMTCSACSNGLEKYLKKQDGIIDANVNLVMACASITYEDFITNTDLDRFVSEAGFNSTGPVKLTDEKKKVSKTPFIIYGILAFILMYISMSHMFSYPIPKFLDMKEYPINYGIFSLLLTLPFLFYGKDIIKNGIKNLLHKMPNMDSLVGIGIISSFTYSLFGVIMILIGNEGYVHNLYFESVAFVIYFVKLGRYIDKNSKEKTKEAIKGLVMVTPLTAKIKTEQGIKEITLDEVKKGDILICFPGDKVAVDGIITEGTTHTDESFITGESKPVSKNPQDKVIAGSINYDGTICYKAQKIGKESTISEIVNLVIESTNTKAPISLLADKVSGFFVPLIMLISILTFIVCLFLGIPFNEAINRFVTVLVIACPCSLGLATPLAIVISNGVCASKGILIKTSETLELTSKINTIVFDKTGTLTNGHLYVSKIINYSKLKENELLSLLLSIEQTSTHPIALSLTKYIKDKNIKAIDGFETKNIDGYGIKATYENDTYYVGSSKLLKKYKIKNQYTKDEENLSNNGNSIVYIAKNNEILALIGIKDTVRDNAKTVINSIKKLGIDIIMLTGDNELTANIIAKELSINSVISNVTPKEKANIIKDLKAKGQKVIMVGDGINDAPSLALADIGISLTSSSDIANNSSDVILINNDLSRILDLISISKKTLRNIKQNLFWALIYNMSMVPIAMGLFKGITINPMIACTTMIFSSLFVIFNALRLKK